MFEIEKAYSNSWASVSRWPDLLSAVREYEKRLAGEPTINFRIITVLAKSGDTTGVGGRAAGSRKTTGTGKRRFPKVTARRAQYNSARISAR